MSRWDGKCIRGWGHLTGVLTMFFIFLASIVCGFIGAYVYPESKNLLLSVTKHPILVFVGPIASLVGGCAIYVVVFAGGHAARLLSRLLVRL